MRRVGFKVKTVLLIIIMLILAGCSYGAPVEDLLSPPKLTDEQSAIYKALTDSKGGGFKLKYPKSGEYRSAFVVYGEKEDAAIVFYEISGINTERSLWMNFLYKTGYDKWESAYDLPVLGTDIERISFTRFGDDEINNIIVTYNVNQNKKCLIISDIDRTPVKQFEDDYSFMAVDYFFGKDHKELMIIKNDRSLNSATATFYTCNGGQLFIAASCVLDPDAGEYTDITKGNISENVEALFINHKKYENSENYGTDVLYYSGNKLFNPIVSNINNTEKVLRRTNALTELANPRDINGDGIIELCQSSGEFPGYSALTPQDKMRPVIWRVLENGSLEEKYYSYYTEKFDYVFFLPSRWIYNVTAKLSPDGSTVEFYEAAPSIEQAQTKILSIRIATPDDKAFTGLISENWKIFKTNPEKGFRYYIRRENPENPLTPTDDELEFAFRILSQADAVIN